jgi:hypothetical protein
MPGKCTPEMTETEYVLTETADTIPLVIRHRNLSSRNGEPSPSTFLNESVED